MSLMTSTLRKFRRLAGLIILMCGMTPVYAAEGLFPKTPPAEQVFIVNFGDDGPEAKRAAYALQGMVNQASAEVYIPSRPADMEQLKWGGKAFTTLAPLAGHDSGLRTLFKKYQGQVRKLCLYDPRKDWTFYLAVMAGAQGNGIPVTQSLREMLTSEFGWRGTVEDFRDIGANRIEGYSWALEKLMPGCTRKVVFVLSTGCSLLDYAVASKGFAFWLDLKNAEESQAMEKILGTAGYTVGTSLMGYANNGDSANKVSNKYGIGYVVSDTYANGSFWASFKNKTYTKPKSDRKRVIPERGKVYVSVIWSDGDNVQFDQGGMYAAWQDPARGTIPIGSSIAPVLQELNAPLMDYYHAHLTPNDELIAGPCGFQFIFLSQFNQVLLPRWCALNKCWCADAGLDIASVWLGHYPSPEYETYTAESGLKAVFHNCNMDFTNPRVMNDVLIIKEYVKECWSEKDLHDSLAGVSADPAAPVLAVAKCIMERFANGGYGKVREIINKLNEEFPGKYVVLLPSELVQAARDSLKSAAQSDTTPARPQ